MTAADPPARKNRLHGLRYLAAGIAILLVEWAFPTFCLVDVMWILGGLSCIGVGLVSMVSGRHPDAGNQ
jgi:hypothetical protein